MEYFAIGDIMRSARLRHGLTQEELAFGICSVSTLSKIENGVCEPHCNTFEALMQRMGEPVTMYACYMGKDKLRRIRILRAIERNIRFRKGEKVRDLLKQYEEMPERENLLETQGRNLAEAAVMLWDGLAPEQVYQKLEAALGLTCPNVTKYWRQSLFYTRQELLIFQMMAFCCQKAGQYKKAEVILTGILRCQQTCFSGEEMVRDAEPSVCYQLAELYFEMRRYPDSRRFCTQGIRCCIETEKCHFLSVLLAQRARIMAEIGDAKESRRAENHAVLLKEIVTNENYLSDL